MRFGFFRFSVILRSPLSCVECFLNEAIRDNLIHILS